MRSGIPPPVTCPMSPVGQSGPGEISPRRTQARAQLYPPQDGASLAGPFNNEEDLYE